MHSSQLLVETEYISAGCNCTYNSFEIPSDDVIIYGANNALVFYDFEERKAVRTAVAHDGRVNCVRSIKFPSKNNEDLVTCGSDGKLVIWKKEDAKDYFSYSPVLIQKVHSCSVTVCDGIECSPNNILLGCISALSQISLYQFNRAEKTLVLVQEVALKLSIALDLAFHKLEDANSTIVLACGMDNGSVVLYGQDEIGGGDHGVKTFSQKIALKKHEDWVRCVTFANYKGETLLAAGGEDSFISIWRFTAAQIEVGEFEFQVHKFGSFNVLFESIIMGHEGWINSLQWSTKNSGDQGGLISCSSDQSIIIWDKGDDMWVEKYRFGTIGGQIPGGFGAKSNGKYIAVSGFQGAIQIWQSNPNEEEPWILEPSITGHFGPISDLDYHLSGRYIVTTSEDQTTRAHSQWGENRWHEISRPQIHGHDLFTVKVSGDYIVSGAEEKILRAFQPTDIFVKNLENASEIPVDFLENIAPAATLPALGLSNLPEDGPIGAENSDVQHFSNLDLESRLDEDFLRSQTLWPEVSKLYGHVYEICCIATSPVDPLIVSGSQSSKPQFSSIILWSSKDWKNLGEFPLHKLNVTDMEFSSSGDRLLSASRDRTWALWRVIRDGPYSLQVLETGSFHTRALWVSTWGPNDSYFVTGARDKKLAVWTSAAGSETTEAKHAVAASETFVASVSAASVNVDNLIAVGLENGLIFFYRFDLAKELSGRLALLVKLDNNAAHHSIIRRLKYNPQSKKELASAGADHFIKVYRLTYPDS